MILADLAECIGTQRIGRLHRGNMNAYSLLRSPLTKNSLESLVIHLNLEDGLEMAGSSVVTLGEETA